MLFDERTLFRETGSKSCYLILQDEADAALVYEEFVASFEDSKNSGLAKTWVKGGLADPKAKENSK